MNEKSAIHTIIQGILNYKSESSSMSMLAPIIMDGAKLIIIPFALLIYFLFKIIDFTVSIPYLIFKIPINLALNSIIFLRAKNTIYNFKISKYLRSKANHINQISEDKSYEYIENEALKSKHILREDQKLLVDKKYLEYAKLIASPNLYTTLYKDVPDELARDIIQDGRMIYNRSPVDGVVGNGLNNKIITDAWKEASNIAKYDFKILFKFGIFIAFFACFFTLFINTIQIKNIETTKKADVTSLELARDYEDIWDKKQINSLNKEISIVDNSELIANNYKSGIEAIIKSIMTLIYFSIAASIGSYGISRKIFIVSFKRIVWVALDCSVDNLRFSRKESITKWRWRLEQREMENLARNDQIKFATEIDHSPMISIGECLGVMEFRSHFLGPKIHTQMKMSIVDLMRHMSVLGGSGEGKTRSVYLPIVRQLLQLRKDGWPIAIYATDDKGAVGKDIKRIAREIGLEREIIEIGSNVDDYKIDLLDGLSPIEASVVLSSIFKQGGESKSDFWTQTRDYLILNLLTLQLAFESTTAGAKYQTEKGIRPYSLLNLLKTVADDSNIENMLEVIADSMTNENGEYYLMAHLDVLSLHSSLDWVTKVWLPLTKVTQDGVRSSVVASLHSFGVNENISNGFATGDGDKMIPAESLYSKQIKIININQADAGGRIVGIMLKTLLFKLGRDSQRKDPEFAEERMRWWLNPKLTGNSEDTDKYMHTFFIADEYQSMITSSDQDGGVSDGSFWNVARSCGISGIFFSQNRSAYVNALGGSHGAETSFSNIENNWRSKIILRTEDTSTIDHVLKLAGKTLRMQSTSERNKEGVVASNREARSSMTNISDVEYPNAILSFSSYFNNFAFRDFSFKGYSEANDLDERFINEKKGKQVNDSEKDATWRQEDKNLADAQHGWSEIDSIRVEDFLIMGPARALCFIQRAGGTLIDFVKLDHNHNKDAS